MRRLLENILAGVGLILLALLLPKGWSEMFPGGEDLEQ